MHPDLCSTEFELKRAVEEIVAPIPADPRLKDQFREELFGHLTDLFTIERKRSRDESTALEEALRRLGDPETIRARFVASLSRLDRLSGRVFVVFERRQAESSLSYAFRGGAYFASRIALIIALLFLPTIGGITWLRGFDPGVVVLLPVLGVSGVVYSTATVFIAMLVDARAERARAAHRWRTYALSVALVFLISIMSGALASIVGHAVAAAVLGARHPEVFMFDAAAAVTLLGGTVSMVIATLAGGIGEGSKLRTRIPDWPYANGA